jgi:hypothetical protein
MWSHDEIMADRTYLQYYYTFDDSPVGVWPTGAVTVPNFALDYSGKPGPRNLNARNANYGGQPSPIWYTDPSEPKLPVVRSAGSDHWVQFNYLQYQWIVMGAELGLSAQHSFPMEITSAVSDRPLDGSTFTTWVYRVPHDPLTSDIVPFDNPSNFISSLISTWQRTFGVGNYGSQLGFTYEGRLFYTVGLASGPDWTWYGDVYPEYTWINFTNIIDRVGPSAVRRRIFINGALVYELVGNPPMSVQEGHVLTLGIGRSDDIRNSHGRGGVDRVAYWDYAKPLPIKNRESWGILAS